MRTARLSYPLLCAVSCALAMCAVFLTERRGNGAYIPSSRSFAVLECPASVPDRMITEALHENGIDGVVSESTQFFFVDAWNGVEQVPLDKLDERLLDIDPRRDGYAAKLRAFFVNGTTRRVFLPLSNWKNKSAPGIEAAMRDALREIPVSSIIIQNPQSPLNRVLLLIEKTAVLSALLIICGLFIPRFMWDYFAGRAYRNRGYRRGKAQAAVVLFLTAVFVAGAAALNGTRDALYGMILLLPLLVLIRAVPGLVRRSQAAKRGHILFYPAPMRAIAAFPSRRPPMGTRPPKIVILLFAGGAAACAASFFAGPEGTAPRRIDSKDYGPIVSAEEYAGHSLRQTLFSYTPLGLDAGADTPPYRSYTLDPGGLYVVDETYNGIPAGIPSGLPPYPFENLAAFMDGADSGAAPRENTPGGYAAFLLIALAALLPFAILGLRHEDI
jgi:hypothetical protein